MHVERQRRDAVIQLAVHQPQVILLGEIGAKLGRCRIGRITRAGYIVLGDQLLVPRNG